MRKIRKHITTIILAVLAVIAGVYAYNYHDMKQNQFVEYLKTTPENLHTNDATPLEVRV